MTTEFVDKTSSLSLPPGSYGLPIIGQTLAWQRDPLEFLRVRYRRYGRIFKSRVYGGREITMLGPEANRFILSSHRDHFEWGEAHEIFFNRTLFGENIFVLDGAAHDRQMQFILPAFHSNAVRGYFDVTYELACAYTQRWAQVGQITAFKELRKLTFEIAARLLLGADTSEQAEYLSELCETLTRGVHAPRLGSIPWTRFARAQRAAENLREYFHTVLQQRRREPRQDVLGMLLAATDEKGDHLGDDEIISHIITLVMSAHDTSTSTMTWLLYELDRHPDIKARLRSELSNVTNGTTFCAEHISQLRYLDLVLKEVERMHPAVTGGPRKVVKAFDFDGYHVPVGSIVYYSIVFTHMMPEIFAEPERFDPDRFAPPRKEDERTPFSLIGFGGGPRSCIGRGFARMEMKIITAALLRGYEWGVRPDQNLHPRYTPTKRPGDGLRISIKAKESLQI